MQHTMQLNMIDYADVGQDNGLWTAGLQKAIDTCAEAGGGQVYIPPGIYDIGTVRLKSNVQLYLEAGAELRASSKFNDFPNERSNYSCYSGEKQTCKSVIYAEDAENIGIIGPGTIHGAIDEAEIVYGFPSFAVRPRLLHFRACKKIRIRDISLRNSGSWVQHYKLCDDVVIDGVTVDSRENADIEKRRYYQQPGLNQDGLDIDSCRNVRVSNCNINSGDDGICLKSRSERPCENVTVTNCTVSSNASGIKLGTESNGGYKNIVINNCVVYDTRIGGIEVMEVDGGICDGVVVCNIVQENIKGAAIFVRLSERSRPLYDGAPELPVGKVRNISISNVVARKVGGCCTDTEGLINRYGCSITGIPGHRLEGISIRDVTIEFIGGGTIAAEGKMVAECEGDYPCPHMFGEDLPAYGFFCRHVEGLQLHNIVFRNHEPDPRPAIILDDVINADIGNVSAQTEADTPYMIGAVEGCEVEIYRCRPTSRQTEVFQVIDKSFNAT